MRNVMSRRLGDTKLKPDEARALIYEYFEHANNKVRVIQEMIRGGDRAGEIIEQKVRPAYTIEGLAEFLPISRQTLYNWSIEGRAEDSENKTQIFDIVAHALNKIRLDQVEGGMSGEYNSTLTARLNGIAEKTDHSSQDGSMTPKPQVVVQDQATAENLKKLKK